MNKFNGNSFGKFSNKKIYAAKSTGQHLVCLV
jgi:hypothetical protein